MNKTDLYVIVISAALLPAWRASSMCPPRRQWHKACAQKDLYVIQCSAVQKLLARGLTLSFCMEASKLRSWLWREASALPSGFADMQMLRLYPDLLNQNLQCHKIPRWLSVHTQFWQALIHTRCSQADCNWLCVFPLPITLWIYADLRNFPCKIEKIIVAKLSNTEKYLAQWWVHGKLW